MAETKSREELEQELEKCRAKVKELESRLSVSEPDLPRRVSIGALAKNPDAYIGKYIGVGGWIRSARTAGGGSFCFVTITDGTTHATLQVVVDGKIENFDKVKSGSTGMSIFVKGKLIESKGKGQLFELSCQYIRVLGECPQDGYPLQGKGHGLEYLRGLTHLRPRTRLFGAVFRIRNALAFATHLFFQQQDYLYVHTPIITASDCEGAGEMFQLTTLMKDDVKEIPQTKEGKVDYTKDFFKRPTFLTVSGQLNVEAFACALSNVYTFGPTFRAEYSFTTRHVAEFWMIEPEIAFGDLLENMDLAEAYVKFVIKYCLDNVHGDLLICEEHQKKWLKVRVAEAQAKAKKAAQGKPQKKKKKGPKDWHAVPLIERLENLANSRFARITYTEAIDLLLKAVEEGIVFENKVEWGIDLASEHERYMAETVFRKPVIVRDYPKEIKAFYMRLSDDEKTVAAMDILVPGIGELVGGSQREERLDVLERRIKECGLEESAYKWYLDLRRYGSVPHSGFGVGFGRLVTYVAGIESIKDVLPYPRHAVKGVKLDHEMI